MSDKMLKFVQRTRVRQRRSVSWSTSSGSGTQSGRRRWGHARERISARRPLRLGVLRPRDRSLPPVPRYGQVRPCDGRGTRQEEPNAVDARHLPIILQQCRAVGEIVGSWIGGGRAGAAPFGIKAFTGDVEVPPRAGGVGRDDQLRGNRRGVRGGGHSCQFPITWPLFSGKITPKPNLLLVKNAKSGHLIRHTQCRLVAAGVRRAAVCARRAVSPPLVGATLGSRASGAAAQGVPQPQLAFELGDLRVAAPHYDIFRLVHPIQPVADSVRQRRVRRPHGEAALPQNP